MVIDGVEVILLGCEMEPAEIKEYINYIKKAEGRYSRVTDVEISLKDDGNVDLYYRASPLKFERIRRITGYLVGTTDRWNNAKRAEERDRVKHGMEE